MKEVDAANVRSAAEADAILAKAIPELSVRQFLMTNLKRMDNGIFKFRVNLDALDKNLAGLWTFNYQKQVNMYHGKTLFIAGGESKYITKDVHPIIQSTSCLAQATGKSRSKLRRLPVCVSHVASPLLFIPSTNLAEFWVDACRVHADKPEEFVHTVVKFLK
eukprot:jgi/Hompol1/3257/HPOL_006431-RA